MKLITSLEQISLDGDLSKLYVTIGNFDGVHRGHADFIQSIVEKAKNDYAKVVVITFVPHPASILRPQQFSLLSTYTQRRTLLENLGVDYVCEIEFTRDFSTLSPQAFFDNFLFGVADIGGIFLGHDFAFGANKVGNHDFVRNYCQQKDIELHIHDKYLVDEERVSSTLIRESLIEGDVVKASLLLGRPYQLEGTVVRGKGRGRELGHSTANIYYPSEMVLPKFGVYITRTLYRGITYRSITNIGLNPTFNDLEAPSVETHLLEFNRDIYGEKITVLFVEHLRGEKRFHSREELIRQIKTDVKKAEIG